MGVSSQLDKGADWVGSYWNSAVKILINKGGLHNGTHNSTGIR